MKVGLQTRNRIPSGPKILDVIPTSAHTDPLYGEHQRIWTVVVALVERLSELEAEVRPTEDQELEIRLLVAQVRRLRRQSERISEVLRDEAWARERGVRPRKG